MSLPHCLGGVAVPSALATQIGVRGSPERDISSLRALGRGWGQVLRVVRAARASLGYVGEVAISCIENVGFV